jgi:hypothetical protein
MILDDPGAPEVRRRAIEILNRSEFQRSKPWPQKVIEWIERHLPDGVPGSSWGGSANGKLVMIVLAVLLLGTLGFIVWMRVKRRPASAASSAELEVAMDLGRSAKEWASDAERFEASGEWKKALRCRYRELVGTLVERGDVEPVPGRTTGELRDDVRRSLPGGAADAFDDATLLFELAWYADQTTGEAENVRFKSLSGRLLSASPGSTSAVLASTGAEGAQR